MAIKKRGKGDDKKRWIRVENGRNFFGIERSKSGEFFSSTGDQRSGWSLYPKTVSILLPTERIHLHRGAVQCALRKVWVQILYRCTSARRDLNRSHPSGAQSTALCSQLSRWKVMHHSTLFSFATKYDPVFDSISPEFPHRFCWPARQIIERKQATRALKYGEINTIISESIFHQFNCIDKWIMNSSQHAVDNLWRLDTCSPVSLYHSQLLLAPLPPTPNNRHVPVLTPHQYYNGNECN